MNHLNKLCTASIFLGVVISFAGSSSGKSLEFSLYDSYGRAVSSEDYKGVPLFLEFGACW